ncbi:MAG: hypothetical protein PF961_20870, partial [Planctomycetota bacterium]|nr:hypothetical protein [Planctomycetota bacterium]
TGPMPSITITAQIEAQLDRRLFGGFLERPTFSSEHGPEAVCDDAGRLPPAVIAKLAELGTQLVRFPGGTGVDYDDWTDLIDKAPGRADPARPLTKGFRGGEYSNRFGLDEFFDLRDELGFAPLLVTNLGDALDGRRSIADAAQHAAGMLAYCVAEPGAVQADAIDWGAIRAANGRPEPVSVGLVAVGNEIWFKWPPKPEERKRLGLADDAAVIQRHVDCLVAYADALHAVSPQVELIVDGLHDPWNPDNRSANILRRQVLLHPDVRSRYRHVTIHQYAPMGVYASRRHGETVPGTELSDDEAWYGLLAAPGIFDDAGRNTAFGGWLDDLVAADYRIAATEWNWNAWRVKKRIGKRPYSDALPMGLGAAGYLNGLIRQARYTDLGCQSMMLGTTWGITAVRATEGKDPYFLPQGQVLAAYNATPGNRVLALKERHLPGVPQAVQFTPWYPVATRMALIDAVAIAEDTGVTLCLVHRARTDSNALRVILDATLPTAASATVRTITGPADADFKAGPSLHSSEDTIELSADQRSIDLILPPAAVVFLRLDYTPSP